MRAATWNMTAWHGTDVCNKIMTSYFDLSQLYQTDLRIHMLYIQILFWQDHVDSLQGYNNRARGIRLQLNHRALSLEAKHG